MSAAHLIQPAQFGEMHSSLLGKTLPEIAARHYDTDPQYMRSLQRDIKAHGIQHPVEVSPDDPTDITGGHHRASVAYRLNMAIPTVTDPQGHWSDEARADTDKWHAKFLGYQFKNAGMS